MDYFLPYNNSAFYNLYPNYTMKVMFGGKLSESKFEPKKNGWTFFCLIYANCNSSSGTIINVIPKKLSIIESVSRVKL